MKDRIKAVRADAGLTLAEFGERLGVTMNYVYMMENGLRNPSPAMVREMCRQFSVNQPWLETGQGEMYRDLTPAMKAADKVRRLLIDEPESTAAAVISALLDLDLHGPEWDALSALLPLISKNSKKRP